MNDEKKVNPRVIKIDTGDAIIIEGSSDDKIYFLKRGELGVYKTNYGLEKQIATIKAGEIFGEMAFVVQGPRTATVRAVASSEILIVTPQSFERALNEQPEWLQKFIATLIKRIQDTNEAALKKN